MYNLDVTKNNMLLRLFEVRKAPDAPLSEEPEMMGTPSIQITSSKGSDYMSFPLFCLQETCLRQIKEPLPWKQERLKKPKFKPEPQIVSTLDFADASYQKIQL